MKEAALPEHLGEQPSAYAEQVREGFFRLRFQPELEDGFKAYFLDIQVSRLRFTLPVAAVLTLLFLITDHLRLPIELVSLTYPARIAQVSGLLLVWLVMHYEMRQYLAATVTVVLLLFGFSIPMVLGQINVADFHSPIHALTLLIVFCYFMVGLRFHHAAILAFFISIPYPLSQLFFETPLPNLLLNSFFLLIFNALGLSGAWFIEYNARESYLNRQLLSELAMHDSLTALPNRRSLFFDLGRLCRQARRDSAAFAVAMIDVDHFKPYNDQFGHMTGDVCLRRLAQVLALSAQRPLDTAARYGGEEFAVIWYDCSPAQAEELAEKLRRDVEALGITQARAAAEDVITVSVGVCLCPGKGQYGENHIIEIADSALYQAKDTGRNRVVLQVYSEQEPAARER